MSPDDRTREVNEKIRAWLTAGTKLLWIVDPELETVTVYGSLTDVTVKTIQDELDGGELLPGFRCPVVDIFPARR